ncbi:MAG: PEP-CTERM sorting domain-containing protein [Planctomycetaceae bacterium]|nr:PEP-CTERM sorting domain-containing protein [Planctomycetaceae bacterium]
MRATLTFVGIIALTITTSSVEASLVANWNFNTYNGDDHSILSDMGADAGASLTIDAGWPSVDLSTQSGTTLNAVGATPAGSAIQFTNNANNGLGFTMQADLTNYQNAVLSFAYKRTGNGFDNVDLFYSTDGVSFTKFADVDNADASYNLHSYDFSAINALDGASTAFFRLVLDGASNSSGTADFDNIQLNAVPEPASLTMLGVGSLAFLAVNRRRRRIRELAA